MSIPSISKLLEKNPIVPVVVLDRLGDAVPVAQALLSGGIQCAEITFRTPVAAEAIRMIAARIPEMVIGAGTIINAQQARQALAAGAQFLVSPGISRDVAAVAEEWGIPYLPGVANPTDIMTALSFGLQVVKFFPAVALGGLSVVRAYSGPFPQLKFVPTGGINPDNMSQWLSDPVVASVGGSWMVHSKLIDAGDYTAITRLSKEAMTRAKEVQR